MPKEFHFDNGLTVDVSQYPPTHIVWLLNSIDTMCIPFDCADWRAHSSSETTSRFPWLHHKAPSIAETRPELLTFADYQGQTSAVESSITSPLQLADQWTQFAFHTESTVLGDLSMGPTPLLVLFFLLCLRRYSTKLIRFASNKGRQWAEERWSAESHERPSELAIARFGETVYQLLAHGFFAVYGLYFFMSEEWWARDGLFSFTGTQALFDGFPMQPIRPTMAWYYIFQAAYNLDAICWLLALSVKVKLRWQIRCTELAVKNSSTPILFYEWQSPIILGLSKNARDDFYELLYHDVLTNSLVIMSSICRLNRAGSMVFLVHDVSAVMVKISKLTHFFKCDIATLVAFPAMLATWFYTRLYILPFVILGGALQYQHFMLKEGLTPLLWICYRPFFEYGLLGLCLLQAYWFVNYTKIYVKLAKKITKKSRGEHVKAHKRRPVQVVA